MPRKATWLVIIWSGLMLLWAASVPGTVGDACLERAAASREACEVGANIGGSLGLVLIFIVWFVGFMVTGLIWLMTRPPRRLCPACGQPARKGEFGCSRCGFDFRAAAAGQQTFRPLPPTGPPPGWGQKP